MFFLFSFFSCFKFCNGQVISVDSNLFHRLTETIDLYIHETKKYGSTLPEQRLIVKFNSIASEGNNCNSFTIGKVPRFLLKRTVNPIRYAFVYNGYQILISGTLLPKHIGKIDSINSCEDLENFTQTDFKCNSIYTIGGSYRGGYYNWVYNSCIKDSLVRYVIYQNIRPLNVPAELRELDRLSDFPLEYSFYKD